MSNLASCLEELFDGESEFRFVGMNVPGVTMPYDYTLDIPSRMVLPTPWEIEDSFKTLQSIPNSTLDKRHPFQFAKQSAPMKFLLSLLLSTALCVSASESEMLRDEPARPDEPMAAAFSAKNAAKSLDASAAAWFQDHSCLQCHAAMMHPVARRALAGIRPMPADVRDFR